MKDLVDSPKLSFSDHPQPNPMVSIAPSSTKPKSPEVEIPIKSIVIELSERKEKADGNLLKKNKKAKRSLIKKKEKENWKEFARGFEEVSEEEKGQSRNLPILGPFQSRLTKDRMHQDGNQNSGPGGNKRMQEEAITIVNMGLDMGLELGDLKEDLVKDIINMEIRDKEAWLKANRAGDGEDTRYVN